MTRPRALVAYVLAVEAAALAVVWALPLHELTHNTTVTGVFVTLAALIGTRPIRIPGVRTDVSATDPFVIGAMAFCGGLPAALAASAGVLGASATRARRPRLVQVLFNLAVGVLGAGLGYRTLVALGGGPGIATLQQIVPLALATVVYFLVNTVLVAGAVSFERGISLIANWGDSALWTSVSAFTGLTLGSLLLLLLEATGPTGVILGLPPCLLLVKFYHSHKERLERQQADMERVVHYNERLEADVRSRTAELREAVSKLEEANREMRRKNVQLSEANRVKNVFLANMSHELRTPLNAIIGFSELMAEGAAGALTGEQRSHCHDIRDSGLHLLHLIDGILDLSKIEAGKLEVHRQPTDPAPLLEEAASMVRPQALRGGLELSIDVAPDLGSANLDPGLFRQVLVNLLTNAVKFTPSGGQVRVRATREGGDLVVRVSDSGIGIDPEQQARIFDEFYQVDASYSRRYQGSGLGLALVRRMVRLHDGVVRLDSAPGEGSTFTVSIPAGGDYENAISGAATAIR